MSDADELSQFELICKRIELDRRRLSPFLPVSPHDRHVIQSQRNLAAGFRERFVADVDVAVAESKQLDAEIKAQASFCGHISRLSSRLNLGLFKVLFDRFHQQDANAWKVFSEGGRAVNGTDAPEFWDAKESFDEASQTVEDLPCNIEDFANRSDPPRDIQPGVWFQSLAETLEPIEVGGACQAGHVHLGWDRVFGLFPASCRTSLAARVQSFLVEVFPAVLAGPYEVSEAVAMGWKLVTRRFGKFRVSHCV